MTESWDEPDKWTGVCDDCGEPAPNHFIPLCRKHQDEFDAWRGQKNTPANGA